MLFVLADLVGLEIVALCLLVVAQLFISVGQPLIGYRLFLVQLDCFFETFFGGLELSFPEEGCPFIMIIQRISGLEFDGLIVRLQCSVVVLEFIPSSTQVTMITCHFGVEFYGFGSQSYLFIVVPLLPHSLALHVEEVTSLALLAKFESFVAGLDNLIPQFQMQVGVTEDEIFLFGARQRIYKLQKFFVLPFGFESPDLLGYLLGDLEFDGTTALEIIQFNLHLYPFVQSIMNESKRKLELKYVKRLSTGWRHQMMLLFWLELL